MEKTEIKLLTETPVETIRQAFVDAFSEYEVPIEMPLEKFKGMIKIRDLNPEFSLGYFVGEKLVGFILCGFRVIDGKKYCYDGATGVVKDFQRKGIGEQLLAALKIMLKEKGVEIFVLEVLENNTPAIHLYQKHGFRKTRRLECFEIQKNELKANFNASFAILTEKSILEKLDTSKYMLYAPSWQNSAKSIKNGGENYMFKAIEINGEIACYGFIDKTRGDIPQICISEKWKNKALEELLLVLLARETTLDKIVMLNIEENKYLGNVLRKAGFTNFVNQFEMVSEF